MSNKKDHTGRWYLGSMNDAAFIINGPPSPAMNDVGPHMVEDGAIAMSKAIDEVNGELIISNHNAIVDQLRRALLTIAKFPDLPANKDLTYSQAVWRMQALALEALEQKYVDQVFEK